jgi:hypothetical protein
MPDKYPTQQHHSSERHALVASLSVGTPVGTVSLHVADPGATS